MWSTGSVRDGTGSWKGFGISCALLQKLASAFCRVAVRWSSPRGPSFCNSWLLPTLFPLFFSKPLLLLWYFQFKFRIEGLLLHLVLKLHFTHWHSWILALAYLLPAACDSHTSVHTRVQWDSGMLLLPWGSVPLGEGIQNHAVLTVKCHLSAD